MLDLPAVNLVTCKPLYFLERLITLNLNDNLISDFDEQVVPMLMTLQSLRTLGSSWPPTWPTMTSYRDPDTKVNGRWLGQITQKVDRGMVKREGGRFKMGQM